MTRLYIYCCLLFSIAVFSQEKDKYLPKANDEFSEKKYSEAEANYRISESKFPKKAISSYNLGNTIYKIDQHSEAGFAYRRALQNSQSRTEKHEILHNLGNVFMKEKDYSKAVLAYKDALRNNPSDEETRYNYALAKKMLKENPPKGGGGKDKKDKKDKKDNKEDKKKNKEQEKKEKEEEKEGEGKEKPKPNKPGENGQPKPHEGGISKQRLESLLEAVDNEEKKVQDKVNKHKVKGRPVQTEKDW